MTDILHWAFGVFCGACPVIGLMLWRERRQNRQIDHFIADLNAALKGKRGSLFRTEENRLATLADGLTKATLALSLREGEAQQAKAQLADNLADLSHQLKTPIATMSLLLDLLGQEASPTQKDKLSRLNDHLQRLNQLVKYLLVLARADAKVLPVNHQPLDSDRLLDDAISAIKPLYDRKRQHLLITGDQLYWYGDLIWSTEILINLLKNASEHSPVGANITLHLRQTPLFAEWRLQDAGPGLSSEDRRHLFERFYTRSNEDNGIGLGLAVAKELSLLQHGSLQADNAGDTGGAVFTLRFYDVTESSPSRTMMATKE